MALEADIKIHKTEVGEENPRCEGGVLLNGDPWICEWITGEDIWAQTKGKKIIMDIAVEVDDSLLSPAAASLVQIMKLSQKQDRGVTWDFKCLGICWKPCFAKSKKI